MDSFITSYLDYTQGGECPAVFHRWSALTGIAAYLEKNVHVVHGHSLIYPNMYTMLLGDAGVRKSTAIKLFKKILLQAGYKTFAAEKTSKEKFLADLAMQNNSEEDILNQNLFGDAVTDVTPILIAADEANDFFGLGNIEFISLLGSLWDWNGKYENKVKHGKSDFIPNPIISLLSANTPTNFALAFPASILGQGFFSRLLIIHGYSTGKKIAFPPVVPQEETDKIVKLLCGIKENVFGEMQFGQGAKTLIESIYLDSKEPEDSRFASFHNRRFTHLLKLCMVVAASYYCKVISREHVVEANTYLRYAELYMPKALGEFGKAKDSDVAHKVMTILNNSDGPLTLPQIWVMVSTDLDSPKKLGDIIQSLLLAEKIQVISAGAFAPRKKVAVDTFAEKGYIDLSYLTEEERNVTV